MLDYTNFFDCLSYGFDSPHMWLLRSFKKRIYILTLLPLEIFLAKFDTIFPHPLVSAFTQFANSTAQILREINLGSLVFQKVPFQNYVKSAYLTQSQIQNKVVSLKIW